LMARLFEVASLFEHDPRTNEAVCSGKPAPAFRPRVRNRRTV
jgi:hypothetical protein